MPLLCSILLRRCRSVSKSYFPHVARYSAKSGQNFDPKTHWPDGTPKKFQGADDWKNWIDWDSPYRERTDELNRKRHFFWEVDEKGALWKLEIDHPGERFGQVRYCKTVNSFLRNIQPNNLGLYEDIFPFVSIQLHEKYFVKWATNETNDKEERSIMEIPIVFNDMHDGELRHVVPVRGKGEVASSVTTDFVPHSLRLTNSGRLLHPVWTTTRFKNDASNKSNDKNNINMSWKKEKKQYYATLDTTTAQSIVSQCTEVNVSDVKTSSENFSNFALHWEGEQLPIRMLDVDDIES